MFDQLFKSPRAIDRHSGSPLLEENDYGTLLIVPSRGAPEVRSATLHSTCSCSSIC